MTVGMVALFLEAKMSPIVQIIVAVQNCDMGTFALYHVAHQSGQAEGRHELLNQFYFMVSIFDLEI